MDGLEIRVRAGITGVFGIPGGNKNRRRVVEFYAERGLCMGNIYFKHKSLRKYTWMAKGQNRVEVKSMIDLVLVKKNMLHFA